MNRVDSSGRRVPVLPPTVKPEDWREHAAFRETFLLGFTSPQHNGALRALGAMLAEIEREGATDPIFPSPPEPLTLHQLRAAAGDLRHLQGFLWDVVEAINKDTLVMEWERDRETWRLCKLARRAARRVAKIADAIEAALAPQTGAA